MGELMHPPVRTWLTTQPPRWAIPMVSAVRTKSPSAMAVFAKSLEASTVPWPPTPAKMKFILSLL